MEYFIFWIVLSLLVALVGKDRKIGYGWTLFWCIVLSPLIGLIIALLSPSKTTTTKKPPKHRELRELGEKAEFRGDYKEAYRHYMDSLYHLENDYKGKKLSKQLIQKQKSLIDEIKRKVEKLKKMSSEKKQINEDKELTTEEKFIKQSCERNGIDYRRYLSDKKKTSGKPYDVLWGLLNEKSLTLFEENKFSSIRNLRFTMSEVLEKAGRKNDALIQLCEVLYYDINGALDRDYSEGFITIEEYPPFDANGSVIAPGIIGETVMLINDLNMNIEELKQIFIEHNSQITNKYIPLSPEKAWGKLEGEIIKNL